MTALAPKVEVFFTQQLAVQRVPVRLRGRDSLTWPRVDALKWLRRGGGGVLV